MDRTAVITVLGMLSLGALVYLVILISKRYKNNKLGEVAHLIIIYERQFILLFIIAIINIAEALMASSIEPVNQPQANGVARWMTHSIIGMAGIFFAVISTVFLTRITEMAVRTKDDTTTVKAWYLMWHISLFAIFMCLSWFFPLLNAYIISGGLKQSHLFMAFVNGNFVGAFNKMYYILQATMGASIAHILLCLSDVLLVFWEGKYGSRTFADALQGKTLNEKIEERGKKEKEREKEKAGGKDTKEEPAKSMTDVVDYLINRYLDGKHGDKKERYRKSAQDALEHVVPTEELRAKLSRDATALMMEIKKWDASAEKKTLSAEKIAAKNQQFDDRTYNYFYGSPTLGEGLGFQMVAKKTGK